MMRVDVQAYDPEWPAVFQQIRAELALAVEGLAVLAIEHVGSTSVPGMAAKPVIDVDVVVEVSEIELAIGALEGVAYVNRGDLGIPDRYSLQAPEDGVKRNIYVTLGSSLAHRNHMAVREALRHDSGLRAAYSKVKLELAQRDFESIDQYVAGKSEVIQMILEHAGVSEAERLAIQSLNTSDAR